MRAVLATCLSAALLLAAARSSPAEEADALAKVFVTSSDGKEREKAGLELAQKDPDAFALALDEIVKLKKAGDEVLVARVGVKLKVHHLRLLCVFAASQFGPEVSLAAFVDRIDNDYPMESARATEALGFLDNHAAMPRLKDLLRNQNELIGIQAARAVARVASKADAGDLAAATMDVDNSHVRLHLVWAVQDVMGGKGPAGKAYLRFAGKQGTPGMRAKEAMAILEDQVANPEEYKIKLDAIRTFFTRKGGVKPPSVEGPKEDMDRIKTVLESMKKKAPAWHHFVCSSVDYLKVAGSQDIFDFRKNEVTLRFIDTAKWDRDELWEYYLVRYAGIMFLARMGDPCEKHRGWEEGMMDAWWYAMDHTQIALDENLATFIREALKAAPW